jgi:hypothetical protein
MKANGFTVAQNEGVDFDLFRLSRSKSIVDLAPNTLRSFNREGLRFFRCGKAVFVSKQELADFIRARAERRSPA